MGERIKVKVKPLKGAIKCLATGLAWLQGVGGFRGWASAWGTVYIAPGLEGDTKLLAHEATHVLQMKRLGLYRFLWQYTKESLQKGYRLNKFEIEARHATYKGVLTQVEFIKE